MKRILSVILCLVIIASVSFQCSLSTSAIAGVDDAVVLGVCLDLLALGISIYNVRQFCQSDEFKDFCNSIGNGIERGFSVVKRNGQLFIACTRLAWRDLCSWVKSKFSGIRGTKNIEFDVTRPSHPSSITMNDGTVVPWGDFMQHPFLIYKLPNGSISAWYCSGANPGVNIMRQTLRFLCTGSGKCYRYRLTNGAWDQPTEFNMTYGITYKNTTGSLFDANNSTINNFENYIQYRTLDKVLDSGVEVEETPPNETPEEDVPSTAFVTATLDPAFYPGAVDAPTEEIEEGEYILTKVPDELVIDADTSNPTLTTDLDHIGQVVQETTSTQVNPKVLTNTGTNTSSVEQIITDTPVQELVPEVNDPAADIETANKFRLPRSFLEGFPFSIPYSVYVGLQSLISEPQAPSFRLPFSIPSLGISEHVDIDLTQFNPVARLCRALLSLVWVAGLAMACNKFIKR